MHGWAYGAIYASSRERTRRAGDGSAARSDHGIRRRTRDRRRRRAVLPGGHARARVWPMANASRALLIGSRRGRRRHRLLRRQVTDSRVIFAVAFAAYLVTLGLLGRTVLTQSATSGSPRLYHPHNRLWIDLAGSFPVATSGNRWQIGRRMRCQSGKLRMEPLWSPVVATHGNRSQIGHAGKPPKQAKTVAEGCDPLPTSFHGSHSARLGCRGCSSRSAFAISSSWVAAQLASRRSASSEREPGSAV